MFVQLQTARPTLSATAAMLLALVTAAAAGDTINVCWDGSGDYLTIQQGIDAVSDGDEAVVCDGTYTGDGNRDLDFDGKATTVRSENGPDTCTIDCQGDGRGSCFHSGETTASVVDGFTDPDGPDDNSTTWEDNDYRLFSPASPWIDRACNWSVRPDDGGFAWKRVPTTVIMNDHQMCRAGRPEARPDRTCGANMHHGGFSDHLPAGSILRR